MHVKLKKALSEMSRINEQKEDIDQKCKVLDKRVVELQEEKLSLVHEMDQLKTKLQREDNARTDPKFVFFYSYIFRVVTFLGFK